MDMLDALDVATTEFAQRLALVGAHAWTQPTPCPDWDVHYLVAHVVGGNRFAALIMNGTRSSAAIEQVMSSPQLGDDALEAWTTTVTLQTSAFRSVGALARPVDHPLGSIRGAEFLRYRVFDITLHAWDLARAVGADERLAKDLVDVVVNIVENGPPGMGFGITALGRVPEHASPQARLLDLTGRVQP